jgi:L-2-hydroxycarboxylate dehydrogenase (NAD+)
VVLDMATTVAAYGKIKEKAQRGEPMPEGWMIGPDGKPLTDASRAGEGFLLPIGGYKGFGLAVILGFLAGTLNGAAFGKRVIDFTKDTKSVTNTGQFICAIDVAAFGDVDAFKRQVDAVVREMKASPTLPGFDEVRLPGEASYKKRAEREVSGVPIHRNLMASLDKIADELGVDKLA